MTLVTFYSVYLARSATGAGKGSILRDVAVGANEAFMPDDTALTWYTHVVVYTKSLLAEQSTPTALPLSDEVASVGNLKFTDYDLDTSEVGGTITWSNPLNSLVSGFVAFPCRYMPQIMHGALATLSCDCHF